MKEVKEFLLNNRDFKYQEFSENLNICIGYRSLGVRITIIRNLAKNLSKKYTLDYLIKNIDEEYYEELLLKGFIIGNYKNLTYDELISYIDEHLTKIRDWSMCDTFAASLKISFKYQDELWEFLIKKLDSKKEFDVRFSLVMILDYYINDSYKNKVYDVIKYVKKDDYYVKMANAWLISYMFIKYFDDTISFINHNKINEWVVNKGITKAIESFRINDEKKKILRKIREKLKENKT